MPESLSNIFSVRTVLYNLRDGATLHCRDNMGKIREKIWTLLTTAMRNIKTPEEFKKKIRQWNPNNCPCRLCKIFIQNIGFLLSILERFVKYV